MIVLLETLDELKLLCHRSLLEWSCCWGFIDCSSLSEFFSSLSLVFWLPLLFIIMNFLYFSFFLSFIKVFCLPIKKKKKKFGASFYLG